MRFGFYLYGLLLVMGISFAGCLGNGNSAMESPFPDPVQFDLDSIKKRGRLILLTENSASTYYLYRGQQKGFDYELMKAFAKYLGVRLEVKILDDVDKMFELLNKGEGDIIASNLTILPARQQIVAFSTPVYQTRQMLVQRKYPPGREDSLLQLVSDTLQLMTKNIWVHKYSSFYERLKEISDHSALPLNINDAPGGISTDDLIRLTAEGEIDATVTDENLAILQHYDYPELDMTFPITGPQDIGIAVRKNASQLLSSLNEWLATSQTENKIDKIYSKYFREDKLIGYKGPFTLPVLSPGQISPYDSLFKKHAKELGWDWRLLAALSYQESRFNPEAESWSGAFGLMQLMPETAMKFGCDTSQLIEPNIRAAVKYIKFLNRFWLERVPNDQERLKFVLASYNIGPGHILDAKVIAHSLQRADSIWDGHVAECLLMKTQEKYYTMEGVKHGFCRAREPYEFVTKVLSVYEYYKANAH